MSRKKDSTRAIEFIESLKVPEGPRAGQRIKLAPFQKRFIRGALAAGILVAVLCVARGNGKSAISAGTGLGALLGVWDRQPRREVLIAARTRDQARIVFDFVVGFIESLDEDLREQITIRRNPRLEVEFDGDGGGHLLRVIAADAKNALGSAPTFVIMDERGHWKTDAGDDLEATLLSGLGKRNGRALIISTSASGDSHSFSQWLDNPPPGTYVQEHRPAPGLPADDLDSLLEANPGAKAGIGSSVKWLKAQATRAIARGGSALSSFRLYNRNERVSGESRNVLITVDEWLDCEVSELPPREGGAVVGVDLGGSASVSAAALYWPNTGRMETFGAFPTSPSLSDRGARDGVSDRYVEMQDRGELVTLGDRVVPAAGFLTAIMDRLDGAPVTCFTADRYRQAEFEEAMSAASLRVPVVWRGQGFKDGAEDVERFRRAVFDGEVQSAPSLLLRSAFSDAVTLSDPAGNQKLAKGRSTGRIDAAAAAILAVSEGARRKARPRPNARAPQWA
ncbi:MAG: terminase TerL endonuclease subunit [Wenzhouxiangella sp.]|nr:terminase TerL endonuclease subunit [Wenzhouxiangella sp.]